MLHQPGRERVQVRARPVGLRSSLRRRADRHVAVVGHRHGRGHPDRGSAPGVRQVLPSRRGQADRLGPRALDQPRAGRGPRRPADGDVRSPGRARRSASRSRCISIEELQLHERDETDLERSMREARRAIAARRRRRAARGRGRGARQASPLAALNRTLGALDPEARKAPARSSTTVRGAARGRVAARRAASRWTRPSGPRSSRPSGSTSPRSSPTGPAAGPSQPRHPDPRPPRGRVRRHGLRGRRGSRGRDRLAQLRGAQHPGRPSGPQRVRHAVPRLWASPRRCCSAPHVAGADPARC